MADRAALRKALNDIFNQIASKTTTRTLPVFGSGIGASIVEHFAEQGARVGFVDIDEAASRALVDKIEARRLAVPLCAGSPVK